MQVLSFLYSIPVRYLILRQETVRPRNLVITPGTLIISNHQSKSDPFLIAYSIGFRNILRNFPLNFPVTHDFMSLIGIGWYLKLLNCFDIGEIPYEKAKSLIYIRDLLRKKKTVVLFPEGKRIRVGDSVNKFHRGLDILLKQDISIVTVRIRGFNVWSLYNFFPKTSMHFMTIPIGIPLEEKKRKIEKFYS